MSLESSFVWTKYTNTDKQSEMNEKQMMIGMKHNIIEEDGEHKIPCNGDSTKGFM